MHAMVRFSKRALPALPVVAIWWLGLTAADATMTSQDDPGSTVPSSPAVAKANAESTPPVTIVVSTTTLSGGEVEYSYDVVNGGAIPITAIEIGDSLYGSQLLTWPVGATQDSIPPECCSSPTGWRFEIITTEEQPTTYLYWVRADSPYEIPGGHSLGGFSVRLPHADTLYETCSWTAFLNDGEEYEGVVQNTYPVSVGVRPPRTAAPPPPRVDRAPK